MPRSLHPIAGCAALVIIALFWSSTVVSELFGTMAQVVTVKTTIPWGFIILIPALAATGITGMRRAGRRKGGLIARKRRRMPFIAANGLLVLIPSALFLAAKAEARDFDTLFYAVQVLELLAGAVNISLLGLSMRDGLRLTRGRRLPAAAG